MSDVTAAPDAADAAAREAAVDPGRNIVLEASAGTGKTRVLVERYVNLLRAGIEPDHILAITFTRKAAAEMRARIIERLRDASRLSELDLRRWRELKDHLADIAISTIDAFCLSLIREFPLEADIDPGFELADDTEVPRLVSESLDQALRICRNLAKDDDDVALVFAQLGENRLRSGLSLLLDRRLVAPQALRKYLAAGPRDLTAAVACERTATDLSAAFREVPEGIEAFLRSGPVGHPQFAMLADDIRKLIAAERPRSDAGEGQTPISREELAAFRVLLDRLRAYFLTQDGRPRERNFLGTGSNADDCVSADAWKRHRAKAAALSPRISEIVRAFRRDLNVVQSRGVWRMYAVALKQYERTLEARALLDFSGVLDKAVRLLKDMDEFAESRFRLESRYRHVLVDEFQDTSRAQWDLVAQLVRTWGEGLGAAADAMPPSIFIVADRKQSIYAFRDAEVAVLDEAAAFIDRLRPDGKATGARHAISVSFRAAPELLAFVNDVFMLVEKSPGRSDAFRYDERDRFPLTLATEIADPTDAAIGIVAATTLPEAAAKVADEVERVLREVTVRDRATGVRRSAQPADVAILFRSRDSHREFEKAIEARGILTYVYKGLGFFEADEVQDATAVLRYLADPMSNLRAAAFLRSRIVRLSDGGVAALAPNLASALLDGPTTDQTKALGEEDQRVFARVHALIPEWLARVDRVSPSELLTSVLGQTAYAAELGGTAWRQGRENLKKLRGMIRRFENRGYATLARVAAHLDELAVGDESNAAIDARDAVSLMTVHASKGLEFPIVFVVNMGRGTGGIKPAIRVATNAAGESFVSVADYQSESDEDAQLREREETKRLLYVALTRARDRLYLSATVEDGVFRAGRGSLGEALPPSVRRLFELATVGTDVLTWCPAGDDPENRAENAAVHRLLVAPPKPPAPAAKPPEAPLRNLSFDW